MQYEGLEASPNIYYTGATTNQQIIPAMDFLASKGVKRLFLAGSDYVFPRTANAIIKLYAAKLGIEIVGEEYVPLDKDDWTTQVAKIVAAKPDFIFNTINGSSNVGFIKAYYDAGLTAATTPIISVSIAEEEAPAMGHEVTGHYASWNYFQSLKTDTNPKFIESWKAYPNSSGVTSDPMEAAYISLYLYKALVEAAGSFDVDAVNAAARRAPSRSPHRRAPSRSTAKTTTSQSRATSAGSTPTTSSTSSGPPTSSSTPTRSSTATTGSRRTSATSS